MYRNGEKFRLTESFALRINDWHLARILVAYYSFNYLFAI